MSALLGMRVVSSLLARDVRDEFRVERNPIKKRRRGWLVVKHRIDRPGCYRVGDTLYMHPDLIARLQRVAPRPY